PSRGRGSRGLSLVARPPLGSEQKKRRDESRALLLPWVGNALRALRSALRAGLRAGLGLRHLGGIRRLGAVHLVRRIHLHGRIRRRRGGRGGGGSGRRGSCRGILLRLVV